MLARKLTMEPSGATELTKPLRAVLRAYGRRSKKVYTLFSIELIGVCSGSIDQLILLYHVLENVV